MDNNETDKEYYKDIFSVSSDVVEEYAKKIQQAVKEKDRNSLADLFYGAKKGCPVSFSVFRKENWGLQELIIKDISKT